MGETIGFRRADGKDAGGYLAKGEAGGPGVVVISEWWGLQDQITGICERYAQAGYTALAPDLYGGEAVPYHDVGGAEAAMGALDFMDATGQTTRGAVQHLAAMCGKVGLTGYCMGGAITIIGAVHIPELAATVCYYGIPPAEVAAPADIRVPIQCHFANQDDWCTPEAVTGLEAALKAAGKDFELYRYDAGHGFANEQRPDVYDAGPTGESWTRTLEFWGRHLA